jgi:hypothetical protein
MTSSTATTINAETRPLRFEASKQEASFLKGYALALGITPDEAFTRFVRKAIGCGYTYPERKEARPA